MSDDTSDGGFRLYRAIDLIPEVVESFYDEVRQNYDGALAFCRGDPVPRGASEEWRQGWEAAQRAFAGRKR